MTLLSDPGRQIGDFLTYILLPVVCVVLPYRWGQGLILRFARNGWLLQSRSKQAFELAGQFVAIENARQWQQSWRLVEMMEARDLWLSVFGRAASISRQVEVTGLPRPATGTVAIGMHWGPAAVVLHILRQAGLGPRFVYRGIDTDLKRVVPFQWIYSKLNVRYIRQTCQGRDITVPGARSKLQDALTEPGTPVILLDAPVTRSGKSIHAPVLSSIAEFSREGPELLIEAKATCVFYWLEFAEDGSRKLHFSPAAQPQSAEGLVRDYAMLMTKQLRANSAAWRLWHAADQLFRDGNGET